jgi:hypothetical protein
VKWISRRRPSPALIVASLALFVSLSGVSYGVATGFIDSREIKNNEVRSLDIRNNEIRTGDLRNNQVRGVDIRNSTVQGRDIGLNTVTGLDINEGTLAKVPSATAADTATRATTAGEVSSLKIIQTTLAEGASPGATVTLATHGALTLLGSCEDSGGGDTLVKVLVDTSEDNSAAGRSATPENPDLDAADPPLQIGFVDDPAAAPQSVEFTDVFASAPSGRAFTGQIAMYADAAASSCKFHGHLALQG